VRRLQAVRGQRHGLRESFRAAMRGCQAGDLADPLSDPGPADPAAAGPGLARGGLPHRDRSTRAAAFPAVTAVVGRRPRSQPGMGGAPRAHLEAARPHRSRCTDPDHFR